MVMLKIVWRQREVNNFSACSRLRQFSPEEFSLDLFFLSFIFALEKDLAEKFYFSRCVGRRKYTRSCLSRREISQQLKLLLATRNKLRTLYERQTMKASRNDSIKWQILAGSCGSKG